MSIKTIITDTFRLLTFRLTEVEMAGFGRAHLIFGLLCTWIVGMGRYWDDPKAGILQHLGVGSLLYVFILAFLLWIIINPLGPKNWSYFRVVTFVSLVSPPAILYAIPVERFSSIDTASGLNVIFLLIVAIWRVALLLFFIHRFASLSGFTTLVAAILPITAIVWTLAIFNLERAVFDVMGGFREKTANDSAYGILFVIVLFSTVLFPLAAISYMVLAYLNYIKPENFESPVPRTYIDEE